MGENSAIEWCTHTFNPWVGCTKVSAACDHCYAETWAKRSGHPELWQGQRRHTAWANWNKVRKWNATAQRLGERHRVFCASLADVFDNQVPERWRDDLWFLIEEAPHLDWLLLTKRPQNIRKMLPNPKTGIKPWGNGWPNVWLGTTCEDATEYFRRWPVLSGIPAAVRFISYEPALGFVAPGLEPDGHPPDWIICGGESGGKARFVGDPIFETWARDSLYTAGRVGTAFFFKQMPGKRPIPPDLLVRQFPTPRGVTLAAEAHE